MNYLKNKNDFFGRGKKSEDEDFFRSLLSAIRLFGLKLINCNYQVSCRIKIFNFLSSSSILIVSRSIREKISVNCFFKVFNLEPSKQILWVYRNASGYPTAPPGYPECGFEGEKCQHKINLKLVWGLGSLALIAVVALGFASR